MEFEEQKGMNLEIDQKQFNNNEYRLPSCNGFGCYSDT